MALGFDKLDADTERERLRKLIPQAPQDSSHFEIGSDNPCYQQLSRMAATNRSNDRRSLSSSRFFPTSSCSSGDGLNPSMSMPARSATLTDPPEDDATETLKIKLLSAIAEHPGSTQQEIVQLAGIPANRGKGLLKQLEGQLWSAKAGPRHFWLYYPGEPQETGFGFSS